MATIIGGYDTGLLDTSLYLLNRNDKTREGVAGHDEELYVNVSNGNLIVRHVDAYLPSQGEDYALVRTYNSRGSWNTEVGKGWTLTSFLELSQITNNKVTLVNPDSSQFVFTYDSATGNYRSVDGAGAYEEIVYNKSTKTYMLVRSNQTRLFFDNTGTMVRSEDPAGNAMIYSYAGGKLASVQDDTGHTITYRYTGSDLTSIVDETGVVLASYTYTSSLLATSTDRSGHVTRYEYYTDNRLKSVTLPYDPAAGEVPRTISFTYVPDPTDSSGKTRLLSTLTDAEGYTTYFKYQLDLDNFSKYNGGTTWMLDALGARRMQSNDSEYRDWRLAHGYYDTWNADLYATNAGFKAQADEIAARHTIAYTYNRNGAILSVTDAKGYVTRYTYDGQENLIAVLDANGDAIVGSDDAHWRDLRRDYGYVDTLTGQGKLVSQLTAAEIEALKERYTTHFEYDARGNLIARVDAEDNRTTYAYTAFNKLASETAAMGHALTALDDAFYQQKRLELGYSASVADLSAADQAALLARYTTTYSYDAEQNLIEIQSPGGDLTRFAYDGFGNRTAKTVYLDPADLTDSARQQVTRYLYDAYGNNTATIEANAWSITHSDDAYWRDLRREYGIVDPATGEGKAVGLLTVSDIAALEARYTSHASYDHFGNRTSYTDPNGNATTYHYDQDNRLTMVVDPEGHVTVNTYDSVGNRTAIKTGSRLDAAGNVIGGHTVIYLYDRNNMLIAVTDPAADEASPDRVTTFKYDVLGQRTAVTDAEGRTTTYVYREDRRLIEVIAPTVKNAQGADVAYKTTYSYDAVGNRLTVKDNNGHVTEYAYNRDNLVKQVTDAIGNVTRYAYDANLNQVSIVIGAQLAQEQRRVLRYTYDEENQLVAEADALGHVTSYGYDAAGNRIQIIDANGHTRDFTYDLQNRLIRETAPEVIDPRTGQTTRYTVTHVLDGVGNEIATVDENGHTTRVAYDRENRAVLVTDANGNQIAYTYDAHHNRTSVQIGVTAHLDADGHLVIDASQNAQVTTYVYNEFNELVAKTDGMGNALVTSDTPLYRTLRQTLGYVDANGQGKLAAALTDAEKTDLANLYTEHYAYDRVGNRVSVTDNNGHTTAFTYDALNRLVATADALGHETQSTYDGNGNRLSITDANGHTTAFAYDAVNRLTDTADALGVVSHREYDHVGNLLAETRAAGTDEARTSAYIYDLNNRLTEATDPEGHATSYEYDAVGNRLKVTDAKGGATRYVYDALNRTIKIIDPLAFETKFEYDGVGNRLSVIDANGGISRMTYDPGNRLVSMTDAENRTTAYTYDARNNRITQTTAVGTAQAQTTVYGYDAENNLVEVIDAEGHRTTHDYDRVYNRTAATDGNGHTTQYAFDAVNRLIEIIDAEGGKTTYTYDAVGNRLAITDANGHALAAAATSDAEKAALLAAHTTHYAYDARNQLITQTDAHDVVTAYGYDRVGNRITLTRAQGTTEAQTTTYVYDKDDRLVATVDAIGNGLATRNDAEYQDRRTALGYAADVDVLTEEDRAALRALYTTRTEYDATHNVTRTIDALGRTTEYVYDANGRVTHIIDPIGMGLAESDAAEYVAARAALGYADPVSGQGKPVAQLTADEKAALKATHTTTYGYDGLGNRTQVIDALGRATTTYYNHNSEVTYTVDAEGAVTSYAYDANGNRIAATRYATAVATPADPAVAPLVVEDPARDETTRYAYDRLNRLVRNVDAEGYVVDSRYDAAGNLIATQAYASAIVYDPARPLSEQTPVADGLDRLTQYHYDAANRLVASVDAEGFRTAYAYDAVGNRISQTLYLSQSDLTNSELQQTTRFAYDALNRLTSQVSAIGVETRYEYDALGNRITTIEAYGLTETRTFRYVYDDLNRLTDEINPEGTVTHHIYDAVGQMIGHVEGYGRVDARYTESSYDGLGRLVARTAPDGVRAEYEYDAVGNLLTTTDAANTADARRTRYEYDRNRRLTRETLAAGTDAAIARAFAYDAFGNRTVEIVGADTPDARTTQYAYDRNNRRIAETDGNGITTVYDYDAYGNLISRSITDRASGRTQTVVMTYDGRNLLLTDTNGVGDTVAREYDAAGNLRFETVGSGSSTAATTEYAYDQVNRLTHKIVDPAGLALTTHYTYDARNNLIAEKDANGHSRSTAYDVMNRAATVTNALGFSVSFDYDVYGNQTTITTGQYLVAMGDAAYDAAKAAVAMPATTRFAYDAMNRQTHRADALGVVTRFAYDARGNRISQTEAYGYVAADLEITDANIAPISDTVARPSLYAYDEADRLVQETQPAGTVLRYSYTGAGEVAGKVVDYGTGAANKNATTLSYYDAGGRKQYEVDPVGSVTRFEYDDFGNVTRTTRGLGLGTDGRPSAAPTAAMRVTSYAYDLANRVTRETVDPQGLALTTAFEYDERGNRITIIDANGNRGESAYDAANRVIWQRDGEGNIVRFEHDAKGNKITEIRYATNGAALPHGELPTAIAEHDEITRFTYDANDRLIERTDPRGVINRLTYDAIGNVLENIENATGLYGSAVRTKTFTYNLANLVTEQVDANGLVTRYEYDAVYNISRRSEINTWLDTLNRDAQGNATTRTETRVFEFAYDLNNRLTEEVTDPTGLNLRKAYRYDGLGNGIAEIGANGFAAIADDSAWAQAIRKGLGLTDAAGNAIPAAALTDAQKQGVLDAFTTRTWFDAAARPTFTVDPLGYVKAVRYDAVGNMTTAIQYANPVNIQGLTQSAPPSVTADPARDRTVEYTHDKANREVAVSLDPVTVFVNGVWVDGHAPTTSKTYDAVGNVTSETDANGHTTYHYYDSNGLAIGTLDAEGYLTVNAYDAFGNRVKETLYLDRPGFLPESRADLAAWIEANADANTRVVEHVYDLGNNQVKTLLPPATLYRGGVTVTAPLQLTRSFDAFGLLLTESVTHAASDTNVAYKSFQYDAAGRLVLEIAARAEELISSDDAYFLELRRDLGYVGADGQGKPAADLTDADKSAIRASFATRYAYDAADNLRERIEGDRITTFEYDAANRGTRVHLPSVDIVEIDANGNRSQQTGYRFVAEMGYDAAGNMVRELKADGSEILHLFDRANREIGAVDDNNVYTAYGYDFSGNRTLIHRYFTPITDRSDPQPPAVHAADQEIRFEYDRVGRMVKEWQIGDVAFASDDRIARFGYDANGNQVEIIDGRGYSSTMVYDALNRVVETVNPGGGKTATFYDAMGNIIGRQAGGFSAPTLVGGALTALMRADDGITIVWQTDHATNGVVSVRRAGSLDAWQTFGSTDSYDLNHEVTLTGLESGIQYEYFIVSKDLFGNQLSTDTHGFQTVAGVEGALLNNVRPDGAGYAADLSFVLPVGMQNITVSVGQLAEDGVTLIDEALFQPVAQGDGSYAVTLNFSDPARAYFQIRWSDGTGHRATQLAAVEQRQELRVFDGTATAVPSSTQGYDLTVTWDLSKALAQNAIRAYPDATTGETRYNVFVGYTLTDDQDPLYVEATLGANGVFSAQFQGIADGARTLSFYYVAADGTTVTAAPQKLSGLAGLDTHLQRIELAFPDMDTSGATLAFRYRLAGSTSWGSLPASAVNGLSVDVLGLAEGDYEYQADLMSGGKVLRTSAGTFTLREPGSISNLLDAPVVSSASDATDPDAPVSYTLEGALLSFPALLPLATGDALSLAVTDAAGVTTSYPFDSASVDLTQLAAGDYTLHIVKTHTETTTDPATGEPVTTTNTVNDITAAVTVKPAVTYTQSENQATFTSLLPLDAGDSLTLEATDADGNTTSYPLTDASFDLTALDPGSYTLHVVKTHTETVTTPVLDANGEPVMDPETGAPVTQTTTTTTVLADIRGDVLIQPRTLTGAQADALSGIRDLASFALTDPESVFVGITTTSTDTADHVFSYYDDNGLMTFSNEQGGVWTRYFYDAQGNMTQEVRFRRRDDQGNFLDQIVDPGVRPDLATLIADYDAALAAHDPAAGIDTVRVIERTYDAQGQKLSETTVSQAYGRVTDEWRYDRFGNVVRETVQKGVANLEVSTTRAYDAFNRVIQTSVGPFQYFDANGIGHFASATTTLSYDRYGNKSTELNERGYLTRFHYDDAGRLAREWDAAYVNSDGTLGASGLRTDYAYDSFGRVLSKTHTDLTGRASVATHVTTYEYDQFDQVRAYDVAGERTTFKYDGAGNRIANTNARGYTESFTYDAENRVIAHTDRLGNVSSKSYDAYGHLLSERDGNGRVTTYTIGAYGQQLEKHTKLTGGIPVVVRKGWTFSFNFFGKTWTWTVPDIVRNTISGKTVDTEHTSYDWLGRTTKVTDSYGKHITSSYDDGDRLRRTTDVTNNQWADYRYDQAGNRVQETTTRAGVVLRDQINSYNERGWLGAVETNAGVSYSGSTLEAPVNLVYRYDQAGNRVWVGDHLYAYDGENRMVHAYDGKAKETVDAIQYDGFGNRVSLTQAGTTTTYTYDGRQRVISASNGEVWHYDAVGNNTYHRAPNGDTTTTTYDAENRALTTHSVGGGSTTNTRNHYDRAGNLAMTAISGGNYGFNEVTYRDVMYHETLKRIENGWAEGAAGLVGHTTFVRNSNGELVSFDRGKGKTGHFTYDLEGHILSRSDRPTRNTDGAYIEGFTNDPDAWWATDDYGGFHFLSFLRRRWQFGAATQGVSHLKSFVYANGKPVAEASTDHTLTQKKLTLTGGTAVTGADGNVSGWTVTLQASDLAYNADGSLDRKQTALNLAARVYNLDGTFAGLSPEAKDRVAARLLAKFPATDADVKAGAVIAADGYLLLNDGQYKNTSLITDYFVRSIGTGTPQGTAIGYTVRSGDTLMSIATQYYGSPSYWYLLAAANGLSGTEELTEGTTLTIPNQVANNVNNSSTYAVYNENDIIGSTSPEVITVPKPKKKKKWYQKLVQVLIVVIVIVAAVFTAGAALGAAGLLTTGFGVGFGATIAGAVGVGALTGVAAVAAGLAVGVALGAAIGAVTSIVTQGLAIAVGLQEKFDWKGVANMSKSFAVSAASAVAGGWVSQANQLTGVQRALAQGAVSAGGQVLENGKITNVSGILLSMVPGAAAGKQTGLWSKTVGFVNENKKAVGAGLSILEKRIRGDEINAMDWANAAAATLQGSGGTGQYLDKAGNLQWGEVGRQALASTALSLYVGHRMGEDAALGFLGNQLGGIAAGAISERDTFDRLQAKITQGHLQQQDFDNLWGNQSMSPYERSQALNAMAQKGEQEAKAKAEQVKRDQEAEKQARMKEALQKALNDPNARRISDSDNRTYRERLAARLGVSPDEIQNASYTGPVVHGDEEGKVVLGPPMRVTDDAGLSPSEIDARRAAASQDVYDKGDVTLPEGMHRLSDAEIVEKLNLDPNMFRNTETGYSAALYYDEKTGGYVLANRGTEPTSFKDWMTNLTQGSGFEDAQYKQAIKLARDVAVAAAAEGRAVSFTGHSLGGGLASAQALATNSPATTFNAAGLSSGTVDRYDLNVDNADNLVTAYYVEGEVLSRLQDSTLVDIAAAYYGTIPKNLVAATQVLGDVVTGQKPDYASFGIGYMPEAVGRRMELPALTAEGRQMGIFSRLGNTVDLHGMEYVFRGLQYRDAY